MAFGIYVHWPFCKSRCPYCDFNAHVWQEVDHGAWRDALLAEMRSAYERFDRQPVETVFFGGGTPSLMEPATAASLIDAIGGLWGWGPDPEITLEANPTSSEAGRFREFAAAGVNRISVGVQSLRDRDLKALGRTHTADEALEAVRAAAQAVERVSLDLIAARPGQTADSWREELAQAIDCGLGHLSVYQLTFEPGTRFTELRDRGSMTPLDSDRCADIYEITAQMTEAAGLPAYEISNHARPGEECRHNMIYWRGESWIGVGPGAHGRPSSNGRRHATDTIRDPAQWMAAVARQGEGYADAPRALPPLEQAEEYMMTALRLREGASLDRWKALAGQPLPAEAVAGMEKAGMLEAADGRIVATPRGRLMLDSVLGELISEANPL